MLLITLKTMEEKDPDNHCLRSWVWNFSLALSEKIINVGSYVVIMGDLDAVKPFKWYIPSGYGGIMAMPYDENTVEIFPVQNIHLLMRGGLQ